MSAFEQQIDTPPDRRYQYLLIAADPYETVGFKIPNEPLDKREGKFVTHWDSDGKKFTLTLYYADEEDQSLSSYQLNVHKPPASWTRPGPGLSQHGDIQAPV